MMAITTNNSIRVKPARSVNERFYGEVPSERLEWLSVATDRGHSFGRPNEV